MWVGGYYRLWEMCNRSTLEKEKESIKRKKKWKIRFFIKKKFVDRRALQEADGGGRGDQPNNCEWVLNSECKFHI